MEKFQSISKKTFAYVIRQPQYFENTGKLKITHTIPVSSHIISILHREHWLVICSKRWKLFQCMCLYEYFIIIVC